MREDEDPLAVCVTYNFGAGLLLVAVFGFPGFGNISLNTVAFLLCSGVSWAIAGYCDTRSYIDLEASVNALFGALRFVLLVAGSALFFHEPIHLETLLGVTLILLSITLTSDFKSLKFRRGALFRLIAVVFINIGILTDKHLTTLVPMAIIVASSYLLPGGLLALCSPKRCAMIPSLIRRVGMPLLFIIPLQACIYAGYVYAFSSTELVKASAALHSSMILTFVLEVLIEKKHHDLVKRGIAALACTLGVILVTCW